jgi:hypothetical protein
MATPGAARDTGAGRVAAAEMRPGTQSHRQKGQDGRNALCRRKAPIHALWTELPQEAQ